MRKQDIPLDFWGMVPDLAPEEVPADKWGIVQNIVFRTGAAERVGGVRAYATTNQPVLTPLYLQGVRSPTDAFLIVVNENSVWVTNGSNWWDITPVDFPPGGFQVDGLWTGCELNGIPCINHPSHSPWYWDRNVANPLQPLPDWPANTTCAALRASKFHLFALAPTVNSEVFDMQVLWSDAAPPGNIPDSWTPAANNEAGDVILAATRGALVDAVPLRDQLIIYKRNSCYLANYIGGSFVWSFRKLFSEDGAASVNCVAEFEGQHIVLTSSDVKIHDGQNIRTIADREVRESIFSVYDQAQFNLAQVVARPARDEIWVAIPALLPGAASTGLTNVLIWNPRQPAWGGRELKGEVFIGTGLAGNEGADDTYDGPVASSMIYDETNRVYDLINYSATVEEFFLADHANGRVGLVDGANDYHGEKVQWEMRREGMALPSNREMLVTELWPDIAGEEGESIAIRCGSARVYGEPVTYCPQQLFRVKLDRKVDFLAKGRYVSVLYEGTGGLPWRLDGQRLRVNEAGRW